MMTNTAAPASGSILPSPDLNPHPPQQKFPVGACDSHAHVFGPRDVFPCAPNAAYLPPAVTWADYDRMLQTIGCQRAVLVQPAGNAVPGNS